MILEMTKVRILGPRDLLADTLRAVQNVGVLHLAPPRTEQPLAPVMLSPRQERERRALRRTLDDLEVALAVPDSPPRSTDREPRSATTHDLARWARLARRVRRESERLDLERNELHEERALILRYRAFFPAFRALIETAARWPRARVYHVLLRKDGGRVIPELRAALGDAVGEEFALYTEPLPTGETALLVLVSAAAGPEVERLLGEARVQEIPVPASYGGVSLADAIPRMLARLEEIPTELARIARRRSDLAEQHGAELQRARAAVQDRLAELRALPHSATSTRAFVVEGWIPTETRLDLESALSERFEDRVAVSYVGREEWATEDVPVVLRNPRLLRPFEAMTSLLPLPRSAPSTLHPSSRCSSRRSSV